jgi:hypothetical protein
LINYFLKMLVGNAIRLQTFSLINLTAVLLQSLIFIVRREGAIQP